MRRLIAVMFVGAAVLALGLGGRAWWARHRAVPGPPQSRAEHPSVGAIYKIAANLFVVPGGGGNTAVFVTSNGVVLVDTKYSDRYQAMLDQVKKVTDKPITHVINTHFHTDHTGGNQFLPAGVEIIVQEHTAANMEKVRRSSKDSPSVPERPVRTYKEKLTLLSGQDAIDLYYFGPAHTDGDTFVVFRSAGVLHAGDVFPGKATPVINTTWGGNGLTYGKTIGRAVAGIKDVHYVISGHGPVFTWDDFVDYGEFTRILLERARAAKRAGKTPSQAFEGLELPAKFKDYRLGRAPLTLEEIYRGLKWWHVW
jgi:cyclase